MKKLLLSILILTVASCQQSKQTQSELRIAGGTAHIGFMTAMAETMTQENPKLRISVSGGGSGVGIKQVGEGLIDIGNSGRDVKKNEIDSYGLIPHPVAIDGIAVVVHPENTLENLTLEQIQKIFAGELTNWKELGGEDTSINIYTRDAESGTRKVFVKLALKNGPVSDTAQFASSNGNMKVLVSGDINGIGYMSVGHLDNTVKGVSIDGTTPSLENVKSGAYTIQRKLYMVTKGEPSGLAKTFIDRMLGKEGQTLVKEKGFIPVR